MNVRERAEQFLTEALNTTLDDTGSRAQLVTLVENALVEGAVCGLDGDAPTPTVREERKALRKPSRPQRWARAIEDAQNALADAKDAIEALSEVREEYEEWQSSLPENLQQGTLAEKLDEVVGLDTDTMTSSIEEVESSLDDASGMDLPKGFGRD